MASALVIDIAHADNNVRLAGSADEAIFCGVALFESTDDFSDVLFVFLLALLVGFELRVDVKEVGDEGDDGGDGEDDEDDDDLPEFDEVVYPDLLAFWAGRGLKLKSSNRYQTPLPLNPSSPSPQSLYNRLDSRVSAAQFGFEHFGGFRFDGTPLLLDSSSNFR
ncbi:uncharacterized protein A4U43_C04F16480 [Asparagus officinalis]|uniref:Uncharacterized protein n=1 Tax=Asparagus officinalis TaxID=4686 RepID=A0A5P1F417_ASPOF|nr:uncharacterized protein A4U43_C04F16480 [Asparagus officinalis]